MTRHHIERGDVLATLQKIQENTFHGLLSDPPYGLEFMGKDWDRVVPGREVWAEALRVCRHGSYALVFGGTRTFHRLAVAMEDAGWEIRDCLMWLYGSGFPKGLDAKKIPEGWRGWNTALKPAWEPIILARKPLDGTVANNVKRWGCGAIAIDACRIGRDPGDVSGWSKTGSGASENVAMSGANYARAPKPDAEGRYPANLLLDEDAAAVLDAVVGDRPSGIAVTRNGGGGKLLSGIGGSAAGYAKAPRPDSGYTDSGGPSRFFYTAKVSTRERNAGCEHLPKRGAGEMTEREDGSDGLNSPRAGAGRGGGAHNHHPTLKPLALTEYLARLLLPPAGGTLLVPFSGSGSELVGALRAGWSRALGIELDPEYIEIAHARIAHHTKEGRAA